MSSSSSASSSSSSSSRTREEVSSSAISGISQFSELSVIRNENALKPAPQASPRSHHERHQGPQGDFLHVRQSSEAAPAPPKPELTTSPQSSVRGLEETMASASLASSPPQVFAPVNSVAAPPEPPEDHVDNDDSVEVEDFYNAMVQSLSEKQQQLEQKKATTTKTVVPKVATASRSASFSHRLTPNRRSLNTTTSNNKPSSTTSTLTKQKVAPSAEANTY